MKYLTLLFDLSCPLIQHVDHLIMTARKSFATMIVMTAANCEQRHLFHLYWSLVLYVIEYTLSLLALSRSHIFHHEAMPTILGCIRDTLCQVRRYIWYIQYMNNTTRFCRGRSSLQDIDNTLHNAIQKEIRNKMPTGLK